MGLRRRKGRGMGRRRAAGEGKGKWQNASLEGDIAQRTVAHRVYVAL